MKKELKGYIKKNIINKDLKGFLEKLISSRIINQNLLCLCILIELKGCLCEDNYVNVINEIKKSKKIVNYKSFTNNAAIIFNEEYSKQIKFTRIVSLPIFETFIGSFKYKSLKIESAKIVTNGWSTKNGVVWVTPHDEIIHVIAKSKLKRFPADDVCDHVGFARTKSFANTRSPRKPNLEFIAIHYSEGFNEKVYQTNSSNADWKSPDILFISYPKIDGFGRTYNENGIIFAKEQVHEKSFYFDKDFKPEYVGEMSIKLCSRSKILDEAFKRLNI